MALQKFEYAAIEEALSILNREESSSTDNVTINRRLLKIIVELAQESGEKQNPVYIHGKFVGPETITRPTLSEDDPHTTWGPGYPYR